MKQRVVVAVEPDSDLARDLTILYPGVEWVFDTVNFGLIAIHGAAEFAEFTKEQWDGLKKDGQP